MRYDNDPDHDKSHLLSLARNVLRIEADAILALSTRLGHEFLSSVDLMLECKGRVAVSGIGKSGHIARKIAATLASTGTPALFLHPAEASHGDLGMITSADVLLAISNSGESKELLNIIPFVKRRGIRLIAMTGDRNSTLSREADAHLDSGVEKEACPLGLAPTASTTAALALGDALALALLDARGFSAEDFADSHPAGALGQRFVRVRDVMHEGEAIPWVAEGSSLSETVVEMSRKGLGMTAVVDNDQRLIGVFTDGDLRRALATLRDLHQAKVVDVMTRTPRTIAPDRLAVEAVRKMESEKITALLVVQPDDRLVGALNIHDLFKAGVF